MRSALPSTSSPLSVKSHSTTASSAASPRKSTLRSVGFPAPSEVTICSHEAIERAYGPHEPSPFAEIYKSRRTSREQPVKNFLLVLGTYAPPLASWKTGMSSHNSTDAMYVNSEDEPAQTRMLSPVN